jgi:plasmid stabilization system protein ParE
MARLSPRADRQAEALFDHFVAKNRIEAALRLREAIERALAIADQVHLATRAYPSAYRSLRALGLRWFKVHRYWFAFVENGSERIITYIVYDQANIPSRIK